MGVFSNLQYLVVGAGVVIEEEAMRAADMFVARGKALTPEGRKKALAEKRGLVSKGGRRATDFSQVVAKTVQRTMENVGLVTKGDLVSLDKKVDELGRELDISLTRKEAGKKPEKKKAAAKKAKPRKKAAKKKTRKKPAAKKAK